MTRTLLALSALLLGIAISLTMGASGALVVVLATTALAVLLIMTGVRDDAGGRIAATRQTGPEIGLEEPPFYDHPSFRTIIERLPDPILIVANARVVAANPAAQELLGEHIIGSDVRTAIRHPAAADRLANPRPDSPGGTIELVGLGKQHRRIEMRTIALPDNSRFVVLTDQTAVDAAERMRADFVANASHELRTPLAGIVGFVETLADPAAGSDRETRERFLGVLDKEARRMQRLIEDLLSLSRIEASKFRQPHESIDLADLIRRVVEEMAFSSGPRGRDIAVEITGEVDLVQGDAVQLSQMLHNIIGNAMKYGRAGTPVRIVLAPRGGNMMEIAVEDEGEGIEATHLPRLTERFYRVDSARSRALGGTGLGLSLVKHIVERHRGRLDITSKPGVGTRVATLLPIARDSAAPR